MPKSTNQKNRKINYTKNNTINSIHDLDSWVWVKIKKKV